MASIVRHRRVGTPLEKIEGNGSCPGHDYRRVDFSA
jgi:hypothetical protein